VQADQIRRYALAENLKRQALDSRSLEDAWRKVPATEKTNRRVATAAAHCFIALGGCAQAHLIIEEALAAEWDSELIGLYAECDGGDTLARIERAESWLRKYPRDATLLLTLGRLCAQQELWGKAQSYLDASIAIEPTYSAHLALAKLHERLDNLEAAHRNHRASLDLALAQLRSVTGGRRRAAL
jgi:HemY protein